jgi:gp16 family phage-associated protein
MSTQKLKTPEQVRAEFKARGESLAAWGKERGFDKSNIYRVLNGYHLATKGKGHQIAVALGLKADPALNATQE